MLLQPSWVRLSTNELKVALSVCSPIAPLTNYKICKRVVEPFLSRANLFLRLAYLLAEFEKTTLSKLVSNNSSAKSATSFPRNTRIGKLIRRPSHSLKLE